MSALFCQQVNAPVAGPSAHTPPILKDGRCYATVSVPENMRCHVYLLYTASARPNSSPWAARHAECGQKSFSFPPARGLSSSCAPPHRLNFPTRTNGGLSVLAQNGRLSSQPSKPGPSSANPSGSVPLPAAGSAAVPVPTSWAGTPSPPPCAAAASPFSVRLESAK